MNVHQEVEFYREENRQLRAMLTARDFHMPSAWGLTRAEEKLLGSLYSAPNYMRRHEALRMASCIDPHADQKVVEVRVCKMRKKLRPHGIEIRTVWGEGYELTNESARIIKEALA
jgi:DNA-binding response OmpR family regulator